MDLYLVTSDGQEYALDYVGSGYYTSVLQHVIGAGMLPFEHDSQRFVGMDGGQFLGAVSQPRTVDVEVTVAADSVANLMAGMARVYTGARLDRVKQKASKIKAVEGAKTAYLDVYLLNDSVTYDNNGREAHIKLRFVAYKPHFYTLPAQIVEWDGYTDYALTSTDLIYKRNTGAGGATWQQLPAMASVTIINSIAMDANGGLYIGGNFTTGVGSNFVYYNGTAYVSVGAVNGEVTAVHVAEDGAVYIAGMFKSAGGVTTNNGVAKYVPGTGWSALGTGTKTGAIYCLATKGNVLYAGGTITAISGVSVSRVAQWAGTAWSALGTGLGGTAPTAYAMTIGTDGRLYVGGSFTTAGGITVNNIAAWNGSTWSALGSGVTVGSVFTLYSRSDGALIVGGDFDTAGGYDYPGIAMWYNNTWHKIADTATGANIKSITSHAGKIWVCGNMQWVNYNMPEVVQYTGYAWLPGDIDPGTGAKSIVGDENNCYLLLSSALVWTGNNNVITTAGYFAKPVITIEVDTGRDYARIYSIYNAKTGAGIYLNGVTLLPGQKIIIDLEKGTITNNAGSNILGSVLPGSDLTTWRIDYGQNVIIVAGLYTHVKFDYVPTYETLAEALA